MTAVQKLPRYFVLEATGKAGKGSAGHRVQELQVRDDIKAMCTTGSDGDVDIPSQARETWGPGQRLVNTVLEEGGRHVGGLSEHFRLEWVCDRV